MYTIFVEAKQGDVVKYVWTDESEQSLEDWKKARSQNNTELTFTDIQDNISGLAQQLWEAATEYESRYISGNAGTLIQSKADKGSVKAQACVDWLTAIWIDYYQRKAEIVNASTDFSDHKDMPYSVLEIMQE